MVEIAAHARNKYARGIPSCYVMLATLSEVWTHFLPCHMFLKSMSPEPQFWSHAICFWPLTKMVLKFPSVPSIICFSEDSTFHKIHTHIYILYHYISYKPSYIGTVAFAAFSFCNECHLVDQVPNSFGFSHLGAVDLMLTKRVEQQWAKICGYNFQMELFFLGSEAQWVFTLSIDA